MQPRIESAELLVCEVLALSTQLRKRTGALPASALRIVECLFSRGALTVPQVARVRQTSRQNIQVIVNSLVSDGWVSIAPNPAHKRSPLIRLTEKGQALFDNNGSENDNTLPLTVCTEEELRLAADVLRRLNHHLRAQTHGATPPPTPTRSLLPQEPSSSPQEEVFANDELPVSLL